MYKKEYYTITKETKLKYLGEGEWINEPDEVYFNYLDFECCVKRVFVKEPGTVKDYYFGGHLCGYVQIPSFHLYFDKAYNEMEIECHGGLTFGQRDFGYWIGFDCAHHDDIIPTTVQLNKKSPIYSCLCNFFNKKQSYKNIEFCIKECKNIVENLIFIGEKKNV